MPSSQYLLKAEDNQTEKKENGKEKKRNSWPLPAGVFTRQRYRRAQSVHYNTPFTEVQHPELFPFKAYCRLTRSLSTLQTLPVGRSKYSLMDFYDQKIMTKNQVECLFCIK